MSASDTTTDTRRLRIWDLPTRLFHWLLAACVFGAIGTAWVGGAAMVWHVRLGQAALALLVFRLVWGLVGGRWSRFSSFLYSPAAVWRYVRGRSRPDEHADAGHNPLGAGSVFALLSLLAVQVGTGLVSDDEIAFIGPLNAWVSSEQALAATSWHRSWGQWLLLGLIGLHLAAIVWHVRVKRHRLIAPMVTGDKTSPPLPADTPVSRDQASSRLLALVVAAAAVAVALWVARQGA